jgi:hypothetical protein
MPLPAHTDSSFSSISQDQQCSISVALDIQTSRSRAPSYGPSSCPPCRYPPSELGTQTMCQPPDPAHCREREILGYQAQLNKNGSLVPIYMLVIKPIAVNVHNCCEWNLDLLKGRWDAWKATHLRKELSVQVGGDLLPVYHCVVRKLVD